MTHKSKKPYPSRQSLNFSGLVDAIRQVHQQSATVVNRSVNMALTLRNWTIGGYIRLYEQNGADRARYGARLLDNLAEALQKGLDRCYTGRYLGLCRQLFDVYPEIRKSLISEFAPHTLSRFREAGRVDAIRKSPISKFSPDPNMMVERLSFTHLIELIAIDDPLRRAFYEIECIRGNWSVRELHRQIVTLYFERSGLSKDKKKLAAMVKAGVEMSEPKLTIRDPYVFEFLGLKSKEAMSESDLEDALLDRLQEFLLELGHGFCFEARQKSILIGNTRGFVDIVFYNRILKCHVLIELKVDEFRHEHVGQLNTYVTWYRKHMMAEGDNPPVGLLLCMRKDHALVEYALAGINNRLFVSKYQLELPSKKELEHFLEEQRKELEFK